MDVREVERPRLKLLEELLFGWVFFFFFPDVLPSSQQLLSNPNDCGALPTSN